MVFALSSGTVCHAAKPSPRSPGGFVPCNSSHVPVAGTSPPAWGPQPGLQINSQTWKKEAAASLLVLQPGRVMVHPQGVPQGRVAVIQCPFSFLTICVGSRSSCRWALGDAWLKSQGSPTPAHLSVQTQLLWSESIPAFILWVNRQPWPRWCWVSVCWNTLPIPSWDVLHYLFIREMTNLRSYCWSCCIERSSRYLSPLSDPICQGCTFPRKLCGAPQGWDDLFIGMTLQPLGRLSADISALQSTCGKKLPVFPIHHPI